MKTSADKTMPMSTNKATKKLPMTVQHGMNTAGKRIWSQVHGTK